jgi:ketosteroid isomerase-like protein
MSEHPNVALVRRFSEASRSGDMVTVDALLADDVVWHEIGWAEPRRGKAALMQGSGPADVAVTFSVLDIVANDEHAVLLADATATRGDRRLRYRTAVIYHLRDGRIAERWAYYEDTAAVAAFFA